MKASSCRFRVLDFISIHQVDYFHSANEFQRVVDVNIRANRNADINAATKNKADTNTTHDIDTNSTDNANLQQEHFTEKEGLTSLDIAGAQGVGDRGIATLSAQCRLQSLDISGAHRVTDVAIREWNTTSPSASGWGVNPHKKLKMYPLFVE